MTAPDTPSSPSVEGDDQPRPVTVIPDTGGAAPSRPVVRWHGGKYRLAPWVISHFPPHRVYVEPFGGGGSVLMQKPRSTAEIYNDLDDEVVDLFRVLRDPEQAARLHELLLLTPFSRTEFFAAYETVRDPIERARRLLVRSFMGFGSDGHNAAVRTGFRANSNRSHTTPAHDWANYPDVVPALTRRLRTVVIECRPALQVMASHDAPDVLHYLDPPYLPETRSKKSRRGKLAYHAYKHEMTVADHRQLLAGVKRLKGMVVISGYAADLYEKSLKDWHRHEIAALADGARKRTEVVWLNPACAAALDRHHLPLFREAAE